MSVAMTFVAALAVIALAIGGLAIGVLAGRAPLAGSCGGAGARCRACGRKGCDRRAARDSQGER